MQVGLGVQVGGITTNFTQGGAQATGQVTNLMISGDGFFVVQRGGQSLYTRAGAFAFDSSGNLVTPDGDTVMGYAGDASAGTLAAVNVPGLDGTGTPKLVSYSIGPDGVITGVYDDNTQNAIFRIAMANFPNPAGLEKAGDTTFREGANSGVPQPGAPGTGPLGTLMGGSLEMSNVDLAQEFTNLIIAQRGFQATSRVITTSDQVLEELVNIKR